MFNALLKLLITRHVEAERALPPLLRRMIDARPSLAAWEAQQRRVHRVLANACGRTVVIAPAATNSLPLLRLVSGTAATGMLVVALAVAVWPQANTPTAGRPAPQVAAIFPIPTPHLPMTANPAKALEDEARKLQAQVEAAASALLERLLAVPPSTPTEPKPKQTVTLPDWRSMAH